MKIAIIGSGTWGTALARVLYNQGNEVYLYSIFKKDADELNKTHKHKNLPGMIIPEDIVISNDAKMSIDNADYVLLATPSIYIRSTLMSIKQYISDNQIIINVAKGIEADTLYTISDIINELLPNNKVVVLSGPTHAEEVALDKTTTIVSACDDLEIASDVARLFEGSCIRAYTNNDVLGVEICGALKNVIALAAGISSGIGDGDNAKAAIITRGVVEIARLGKAMGADQSTFNGLVGIGDLIVTATSQHSRNNRCGYLIGQGYTPEEAKKEIGMVVEGINSLSAAVTLANKYNVYMPITNAVNEIINNNKDPKEILVQLMNRPSKHELD